MAGFFNKRWAFFFTTFVAFLFMGFVRPRFHPFHVSSSEIEYNAKAGQLEISSKIFTDDFEAVLSKLYKTRADFSDKKLKPKMDELVTKYITTHLAVGSNGAFYELKLFGWEVDHEAVYVYTTANPKGFNPKSINVENTILYDLFDDQMNIVHFIVNGSRKSGKLNYPEKKLRFVF